MPKLVDLTGKIFGRYTVVRKVEKPKNLKKKAAYWLCRCDCGEERIVISSSLIDYGNSNVSRSCGCLQKEVARRAIYHKVDGCPAQNQLLSTYRGSARKRDYDFDLTKEEFLKLASGNCFYCGKEPARVVFNSIKTISFIYNGVDRLDNTKGYSRSNCVSCCMNCNKAKLDMTVEEFKNWVEKVYDNFVKELKC